MFNLLARISQWISDRLGEASDFFIDLAAWFLGQCRRKLSEIRRKRR
jgi:hypothetical protein